jgi:hypothetical protein
MELKRLATIGTKTVIVIQKNGNVISGKITSHTNSNCDINKITEIKVMPATSIPISIDVNEIRTIEVIEEESYYLKLSEV